MVQLEGDKGIRYNVTSGTDDFEIYDTLNDPKKITNLAGSTFYFLELQQGMKDRVRQLRRPGDDAWPYDTALIPPVTVVNTVSGLNYQAFEGSYPWVPDFTSLTPAATSVCAGLDLSVRTRDSGTPSSSGCG